jgi:hypothetical protein
MSLYDTIVKRDLEKEAKQKLEAIVLKIINDNQQLLDQKKPKLPKQEEEELKERAKNLSEEMLMRWCESSESIIEFEVDCAFEKHGSDLCTLIWNNLTYRGFHTDSQGILQKQKFFIKFDPCTDSFTMNKLERNNDMHNVKNKMNKLIDERRQELQLAEDGAFDVLTQWIANGQQNVKNLLWPKSVCNLICYNIRRKLNFKLFCYYSETCEFRIIP